MKKAQSPQKKQENGEQAGELGWERELKTEVRSPGVLKHRERSDEQLAGIGESIPVN